MNFELVEKIANAVLYEGYLLYPYRPSSVKNRQRFNFGVLTPQAYSEAQRGAENWSMQTQCLVLGNQHTTFDVKARFLHLVMREVGELIGPLTEWREGAAPEFRFAGSLEVGGQLFRPWQEAVEREANAQGLKLDELITQPRRLTFTFPAKQEIEPLREASGQVVGVIVRQQQSIAGVIEIAAEQFGEHLRRVTVRILNLTPFENAARKNREEALLYSLASAHTILGARDGEFVSLLDPPEEFKEAAAACSNVGTWPVLVGAEGERDLMLSSPIILYDYPQIAPESAGDLFDGTEIDEILTLRIMTLTEEEKREMRGTDGRAKQILDRTETLPAEQLMKLHGALRGLRPLEEQER